MLSWIMLALVSSVCLGFYDIFKKISVKGNNVLIVLMLNTIFGTLYLSPVIVGNLAGGHFGLGDTLQGHLQILLKAVIVLSSWVLGYFAIKHLPLTIQGPINATRPVIVLVGALCIFGERLNALQWVGIILGFASLYFISRIGSKEGFSMRHSLWLWMSIGATVLGAVSALYDKYLLRSYLPLEVQAWYSLYQCIIMCTLVAFLMRKGKKSEGRAEGQSKAAAAEGQSKAAAAEGQSKAAAAEDQSKVAAAEDQSKAAAAEGGAFVWRWTIPCIALFLTVADIAYFYSLSQPGSMVSIVSMIRRGSVIISFLYGVIVLREKNIRAKALDLGLLLLSLLCLILASH